MNNYIKLPKKKHIPDSYTVAELKQLDDEFWKEIIFLGLSLSLSKCLNSRRFELCFEKISE
jgi:hypothetical protein